MDVPIKEQVESCIAGTKFELASRLFPNRELSQEHYKSVFSANFSEVKEYLILNYKVKDIMKTVEGDVDGFYAINCGSYWDTYLQERNCKFDEKKVEELNEVWSQYIKLELGFLEP